jgi:hypothetical protein
MGQIQIEQQLATSVVDSWVSAIRDARSAPGDGGALDDTELRAVEMLLQLPPSPFRLAATIKREWDMSALLRIADAIHRRSHSEHFIAYLPRLEEGLGNEFARHLISIQMERLSASRIHTVLVEGYRHEYQRAERALAAISGFDAQNWVLFEREYIGHVKVARVVLERMQSYRSDFLLPMLEFDERLSRCALLHAMDIARRGDMGHMGSDGSTPAIRVGRISYPCLALGENLSLGTIDPVVIAELWMASENHRVNVLGTYQRVGVGVAAAQDGSASGAAINPACVAVFARVC